MPLNRNASYSNPSPDTRWWLLIQPGYGSEKGLSCNQLLNTLDDEVKFNGTVEDTKLTDHGGSLKLQKGNEYCFEPQSPWTGSKTNVPWWRMTDKDDLASMVSQRSHDYIENCDLPPPQTFCSRGYPFTRHPRSSDQDALFHLHLENKNEMQKNAIERNLPNGSDNFSFSAMQKDTTDVGEILGPDPCKAQILEALQHSQTRAREAEKAAKQAYAEKNDLIELFFKQASHLFAYKQWFQLLQLETCYYQIKNVNCVPVSNPLPSKGRKLRKRWQKSTKGHNKRGKRGRPRHEWGSYVVVISFGIGLVGAGLLIGWTVGWMLPF